MIYINQIYKKTVTVNLTSQYLEIENDKIIKFINSINHDYIPYIRFCMNVMAILTTFLIFFSYFIIFIIFIKNALKNDKICVSYKYIMVSVFIIV